MDGMTLTGTRPDLRDTPPTDTGTETPGTAPTGVRTETSGVVPGGVRTGLPGAALTGVRADARIVARGDGRGGTALPVLDGSGPLALRRVRGSGAEARVMVVGAMSGPLGGDRFTLDARVEEGARLWLGSAAATLALPGQAPGAARYDVQLAVADGAELHWLPEQLISATGSDLRVSTLAELAAGARLVLREEQVLGRAGERPGLLTTRLALRVAGRTVLDQQLSCGPGAPGGWDGPAALAGHRAVGQLLVVRPEFAEQPPAPRMLGDHAALMPLPGPAALLTALAPDALRLRRVLDEGLALLG
ncbi:urease accessory protein UreD [Streptomyces sp. NPDC046976]|uniref:urease accessory protein UreD n=1 Tax=Streptomyces sp. NPDC046976 TaxID=3155258 RepID=UPI0033C8E48D